MTTYKNLPGVLLCRCILFLIFEIEMQQYFNLLHCASIKLILVVSLIGTGIICFRVKTLDQENYS